MAIARENRSMSDEVAGEGVVEETSISARMDHDAGSEDAIPLPAKSYGQRRSALSRSQTLLSRDVCRG